MEKTTSALLAMIKISEFASYNSGDPNSIQEDSLSMGTLLNKLTISVKIADK